MGNKFKDLLAVLFVFVVLPLIVVTVAWWCGNGVEAANLQDASGGFRNVAVPSVIETLRVTGALVSNTYNFAADGESSDTYVITLDPAPTAYSTGMMIVFSATTLNTGACTINVNSLGAKPLKSLNNQDPANSYIEAGSIVLLCYDGTNFQILNPDANP